MRLYYIILLAWLMTGCDGYYKKLEYVGEAPPMNRLNMPQQQEGYAPVYWPKSHYAQNSYEEVEQPRAPNSLWQPGARTFFRDLRARSVGDILKVVINVQDQANWQDKTQIKRVGTDTSGAPTALGIGKHIAKFFGMPNMNTALNITTNDTYNGDGKINRQEQIKTQVAAIVTQILPNGSLVIRGRQEMRVNHELREISVEGIVRSEDIGADNSINSDQIAEARISYGGKGQLMNAQEPRLGTQILDIISPF